MTSVTFGGITGNEFEFTIGDPAIDIASLPSIEKSPDCGTYNDYHSDNYGQYILVNSPSWFNLGSSAM